VLELGVRVEEGVVRSLSAKVHGSDASSITFSVSAALGYEDGNYVGTVNAVLDWVAKLLQNADPSTCIVKIEEEEEEEEVIEDEI